MNSIRRYAIPYHSHNIPMPFPYRSQMCLFSGVLRSSTPLTLLPVADGGLAVAAKVCDTDWSMECLNISMEASDRTKTGLAILPSGKLTVCY